MKRTRSCNRDGCGQAARARDMCAKHYRHWLDHTPLEDRPTAPRFQRNFWDFVTKTHARGCWTWAEKPRNKQGYGCWGKKLAHRHSFELANGPIRGGLWVLHHCDNPPCVNPAHLYLGTVVENVQDMVARGRNHVPKVKAECAKGHSLTGDNLRIVGAERRRTCRKCDNDRSSARQREVRRARGLRVTRLSELEKARICELRRAGLMQRQIVVSVGRSISSVQVVLREAEL